MLPDMLRADPPPYTFDALSSKKAASMTPLKTNLNGDADRTSISKGSKETEPLFRPLQVNIDSVSSLQVPIFQHVHSLRSKHDIDPQHESQMYSLYIEQYKAKMRSQALLKVKEKIVKV